MRAMPDVRGDRSAMKITVLAGFGLTLGLWLYVGYTVTGQIEAVEARAAGIAERYTHAQERLSNVRQQVLLASIAVRDALLDSAPDASPYLSQVQAMFASATAALDGYEPLHGSSAEHERVRRLRQEVEEFYGVLIRVLETAADGSNVRPGDLLLDVLPKRDSAVRFSDEVQALNRAAFIEQQAVIADMHTDIQQQVWTRLTVALALGLLIAAGAAAHAGRLERRLQEQRALERAAALELKRLSAGLIEAQERDFRTIARELHDEVGQLLTAVKVELSRASQKMGAEADGPAPFVDTASALTDMALQAVRDLSHLLHPAVLDDLGLAAALETSTREFGRRHRVATDCRCEGLSDRLSPEAELTAYRIVQEALTNVARHAHATTCDVEVRRTRDRVLIRVSDDGVGFEPGAHQRRGRGLGLISMRERVAQLQGTLRVESAPGEGTRVVATWPAAPVRTSAQLEQAEAAAHSGAPGGHAEAMHG
jgi:signal transduction histidine kinase